MRSAPAAQFTLLPQREPQVFIAVLTASAFAVAANWLSVLLGWDMHWLTLIAAVVTFIGVVLGRGRDAVRVRWDGQRWSLQHEPPLGRNDDGIAGELDVVIDLGTMIVLRFGELNARGSVFLRRRRWLIARRRSLRAQWQAFRRAVYSPRHMLASPDASVEEAAF